MGKFYEGEEIGSHSLTVTVMKTELPEGNFFIAEAWISGLPGPIQTLGRNRNTAMALMYDKIAETFRDLRKTEQSQS